MRVLFVCTGNTCRSALAEAIAVREAAARGMHDVLASSAGTSAWDGAPASDGALLVGIERKLDVNAHRSRQLSREMVAESDLILAMGPHHVERIEALRDLIVVAFLIAHMGRIAWPLVIRLGSIIRQSAWLHRNGQISRVSLIFVLSN